MCYGLHSQFEVLSIDVQGNKNMKKSQLALLVTAAMGASGTSLAQVSINQSGASHDADVVQFGNRPQSSVTVIQSGQAAHQLTVCLLYTSDAADE